MGKSDNLVLPPLVNGKLSGILEFGVDYVEITDKTFKNEDRSLLVQIIWWGETKPFFLRPKKSMYIKDDNKQVIIEEEDGCEIKYEVRTKMKLFASYLTKCGELELIVLDSVHHEVIGSAFIKDLVYLVYNAECFINNIINDTGDVIGKVACHFRFSEIDTIKELDKNQITGIDPVSVEMWNNNDLKINLNLSEFHMPRDDLLYQYEPGRTNNEIKSEMSANLHCNSPVAEILDLTCDDTHEVNLSNQKMEKNCFVRADSDQLKPPSRKFVDCSRKTLKNGPHNNAENSTSKTVKVNRKPVVPQKLKISTGRKEEVPVRTVNVILKPSPKVSNKKASVNKMKGSTDSTFPKRKLTPNEKTVRGTKRDKGNSLEILNGKNSCMMPKLSNASNALSALAKKSHMKTFENITSQISKLSKLYLNGETNDDHSDLENVPVKENVKVIVEDINAEDIKTNEKLPCPSLKSSECKQSESAKDVEYTRKDDTKNKKINVENKLFFDLNDPIEKLYYETFFQNTEVHDNNNNNNNSNNNNNKFEIAELLNQPGNNYILDSNHRNDMNETESLGKLSVENELQTVNDINVKSSRPSSVDVRQNERSSNKEEADDRNFIEDGKDIIPLRSEIEFENFNYENDKLKLEEEYKNDCFRCKYYKKLSELDQIIAALKNFESKMRNEVKKNKKSLEDHRHGCKPILSSEIIKENENTESSDQGELGFNTNTSDYSKEDSDFLEFRHYLSNM